MNTKVKAPVTLSRPEVPFFHDLKVTDHCRSDFGLERTGAVSYTHLTLPTNREV